MSSSIAAMIRRSLFGEVEILHIVKGFDDRLLQVIPDRQMADSWLPPACHCEERSDEATWVARRTFV